ncbi:UPF0176 protein [Fistulifera solaris]|uniref:UPF0176 protein n=1 Tax=Fistulifera solaris TaxID=1519565 RepID=A0A1Z5K9W4_FISSO|nr:UPF0176 protein [Fistulifera solaris]|eukprot:GAX23049.1 UPF0176 protein [Fistulifera solaris]
MELDEASIENAFAILALYQFLDHKLSPEVVADRRDQLEAFLRLKTARGMIILAQEGINGTICFPSEHKDAVMTHLLHDFPNLRTRLSYHPENVFFRLKVRIKSEIVTLGVNATVSDPTLQVGTYVEPGEDWDTLLKDPNCLVIDTRNEYEYQVGTFHNAINPHTHSFVDFPEWIQENMDQMKQVTKVAMFCTGGIRCEKATAYCMNLLKDSPHQPEIYHLKGGILGYLDTVQEEKSLFKGECYVFDRRTAVQHGLKPSTTYVPCHACRHPLTAEDRLHPDYEEGVSCHVCIDSRQTRRERYESRQKQMKLWDTHLHDRKERKLQNQLQRVDPATSGSNTNTGSLLIEGSI